MRRYGLGKFNLEIDALVYDATLDGGADEEAGDVSSGVWYGLMRAPLLSTIPDDVTDEERAFLAAQAGAILCEDHQGLVTVEYFERAEELAKAWAEIEEYFEQYEKEE